MVRDGRERLLDERLNTDRMRLRLPAAKRAAVVFDTESDTHVRGVMEVMTVMEEM
jgi:hypothetical protein